MRTATYVLGSLTLQNNSTPQATLLTWGIFSARLLL